MMLVLSSTCCSHNSCSRRLSIFFAIGIYFRSLEGGGLGYGKRLYTLTGIRLTKWQTKKSILNAQIRNIILKFLFHRKLSYLTCIFFFPGLDLVSIKIEFWYRKNDHKFNLLKSTPHEMAIFICLTFIKTLFKGKHFAVFDFDQHFAFLTDFLKR